MAQEQSVVLRFDDPSRPSGPEIVYLHGRGSSEREGAGLLPAFPGAALRAYRGPLREGSGFAWFLNAGIGNGRPESLAEEVPKVAQWIAADNGSHAPWLCGFSNGAAMAASLALADPHAYAGLVMIGGCFASDDLPAGRLADLPVLFCKGRFDMVIPSEKSQRALDYLGNRAGARVEYIDYADGHTISPTMLNQIATWFKGCR
ncbi:MAG: putative esterase [Bradyrhizobium sp.]|nr:putative esterase [Bradyrhizobium sp.]